MRALVKAITLKYEGELPTADIFSFPDDEMALMISGREIEFMYIIGELKLHLYTTKKYPFPAMSPAVETLLHIPESADSVRGKIRKYWMDGDGKDKVQPVAVKELLSGMCRMV